MLSRIENKIREKLALLYCIEDLTLDMKFDLVYFLYILNNRYSDEVASFLSEEELIRLKELYRKIFEESLENIKYKKSCFSTKKIYEYSQIIFNYMGLMYLKGLEKKVWDYELTPKEIVLIENLFGYSYIFDYMILFWAKKSDINFMTQPSIPKSRIEETYLFTHYFLLESDYFTVDTKKSNIEDLKRNVEYVIENNLLDLAAELYWAFCYYEYDDKDIMFRLKHYLIIKFCNDEERVYSGYDEREMKHSDYSCICAFLEERKRKKINE